MSDDRAPPDGEWFYIAICLLGYLAGYLGFVRLCVTVARRHFTVSMLTVFLLHLVVLLAGVFVPLAILSLQYGISGYDFDYTPLQLTNWWWTLGELLIRGPSGPVGELIPLVILLLGGIIFLVNLVDTSAEVEKVRTVAPQRVLEDDAAGRPVIRLPKNPWDEDSGQESAVKAQSEDGSSR